MIKFIFSYFRQFGVKKQYEMIKIEKSDKKTAAYADEALHKYGKAISKLSHE
jgi:hypothetical protein